MKTVNIHEAKTHLSRLLRRVQKGEEIIIAKAGKPVARLMAIDPRPKQRVPGEAKGQFELPDDFDDLPPEVLESFYE